MIGFLPASLLMSSSNATNGCFQGNLTLIFLVCVVYNITWERNAVLAFASLSFEDIHFLVNDISVMSL